MKCLFHELVEGLTTLSMRPGRAALLRRLVSAMQVARQRNPTRGLWLLSRSIRHLGLPMNPPLHPSQEGNLQLVLQTKLPSSEGPGVGLWSRCTLKKTWKLSMNRKMRALILNELCISGSWHRFATDLWEVFPSQERRQREAPWSAVATHSATPLWLALR